MMSGTKTKKFTKGWAIVIAQWGKAHYFTRDGVGLCTSACGRIKVVATRLYHSGTWKRCKLCDAKAEPAS